MGSRAALAVALVLVGCAATRPSPSPPSPPRVTAPPAAPAPLARSPEPADSAETAVWWVADGAALFCLGDRPTRIGTDGSAAPLSATPRGAGWNWREAVPSADGGSVAVFGAKGLFILDGGTGAVRAGPLDQAVELTTPHVIGDSPQLSWSADGAMLAGFLSRAGLGDELGTTSVALWDAQSGALLRTLVVAGVVSSLTWHPQEPALFANSGYGSMFNLSGWEGATVSRWSLVDGASLGTLAGHTAVFSPDGRWLALGQGHPTHSQEKRTHLHDAAGKSIRDVPGLPVGWGDGSWMLTSEESYSEINAPSGPTTYRVIDLPSGRVRSTPALGEGGWALDPATGLAAVKDVPDVYGFRGDEPIVLWDLRRGVKLRTLLPSAKLAPSTWHAGGRVLELRDIFGGVATLSLLAIGSGELLELHATVRDGRCVLAPAPDSSAEVSASAFAAFIARAQ